MHAWNMLPAVMMFAAIASLPAAEPVELVARPTDKALAIAEKSVFKSGAGDSEIVLLTASIARRIVVPWSPSPTALSSFDSSS